MSTGCYSSEITGLSHVIQLGHGYLGTVVFVVKPPGCPLYKTKARTQGGMHSLPLPSLWAHSKSRQHTLPSPPHACKEHAATITLLAEVRDKMDSEMRKCFVGPMPVKEFLEKFLPVTPPTTPKSKSSGFEAMPESGIEGQMYDEFVSSFSVIVGI